MDIILINVESAKERLAFQDKQLSALGLPYQRLNAVTIDEITPEIVKKHYYDWQRPLRKTEFSCYFSHRLAWEIIKEKNKPMVILEDDALLSRELPSILKKLENRSDIDFLNLENRARKKYVGKDSENLTGKNKILRLHQDKTGSAAYVLWPKGAEKLIKHQDINGIALADAHLFSCHSLNAFQVEPAPAVQLDMCGFYKIKLESNENIAKSMISSQPKIKKDNIFIYKRLVAQIKLGIRNIYLKFISERRFITVDGKDFITLLE